MTVERVVAGRRARASSAAGEIIDAKTIIGLTLAREALTTR